MTHEPGREAATIHRCEHCGCNMQGESAYIEYLDEYWCHPCADNEAEATSANPIRNDMRALFRHVDDQDWEYLLSRIGDGGRDRFWKTVIADIRGALALTRPHCHGPEKTNKGQK